MNDVQAIREKTAFEALYRCMTWHKADLAQQRDAASLRSTGRGVACCAAHMLLCSPVSCRRPEDIPDSPAEPSASELSTTVRPSAKSPVHVVLEARVTHEVLILAMQCRSRMMRPCPRFQRKTRRWSARRRRRSPRSRLRKRRVRAAAMARAQLPAAAVAAAAAAAAQAGALARAEAAPQAARSR